MKTIYNIRPKGFNVGNDAIYVAMQQFLYKAFGEIVNVITIPATKKYESQGMAGLTSKVIYDINQNGDGVIIGGGNLYENGEIDIDINALKALDVPLMLFSISRGRIYNKRNVLIDRTDVIPDDKLIKLCERADINFARDEATHSYMKKIGITNSELGGCPTIFLDRLGSNIPNYENSNFSYSNTILISIRNPSIMSISTKEQQNVRNDILEMISYCKSNLTSEVKILCHDIRDISFALSLKDIEYVYTGDVYSYLSLLQNCKLLISYRLHSFLPALSFNTNAIKISYDERGLSLLDTLGLAEWNINMIESKNVVSDVISRMENIKELQSVKKGVKKRWLEIDNIISDGFLRFAKLTN